MVGPGMRSAADFPVPDGETLFVDGWAGLVLHTKAGGQD